MILAHSPVSLFAAVYKDFAYGCFDAYAYGYGYAYALMHMHMHMDAYGCFEETDSVSRRFCFEPLFFDLCNVK